MDPGVLRDFVSKEVKSCVHDSNDALLEKLDSLMTRRLDGFEKQIKSSQQELSEAQLAKIENIKVDAYKFRKRGNEEQHKHGIRVLDKLTEADVLLGDAAQPCSSTAKAKQRILEGIALVNHRQKLIRLADSSEAGWKTVIEYESNELAADSEDEKRLFRAEQRAVRKMKSDFQRKKRSFRQSPYTVSTAITPTPSEPVPKRTGACFACGKFGHWRADCLALKGSTIGGSTNSNVKLSIDFYDDTLLDICENYNLYFSGDFDPDDCSVDAGHMTNLGVKPLCHSIVSDSIQNFKQSPVGRLARSVNRWKEIGASPVVLDVISNGYIIPFKETPRAAFLRNNRSALSCISFVSREIETLVANGCVSAVETRPCVVNPLTVAFNKAGKPRLVLDCRHINPCLYKIKFRYEDCSTAMFMFQTGDYLFTFDLKSAYHHIAIHYNHRTYLGFSWTQGDKQKFYVFNVLPFGISTAGYIFSKVLREVVKFWRSRGSRVVMFLDDGLGGAESSEGAASLGHSVKADLESLGFLLAHDKCQWEPHRIVTWLGIVWDFTTGAVSITPKRIKVLQDSLDNMIVSISKGNLFFTARKLANVIGQIISLYFVMGRRTRLHSRYMYECLLQKTHWESWVRMTADALHELLFWKEATCCLNSRKLVEEKVCTIGVYSDASESGYSCYTVSLAGCDKPETTTKESLSITHDPEGNDSITYLVSEGGKSGTAVSTMQKGIHDIPEGKYLYPDGHPTRITERVQGEWGQSERLQSSTWRELEAVRRGIKSFSISLSGKCVRWYTDNKNICSVVQVGSGKKCLQDIATDINSVCTEHDIDLNMVWIPRSNNRHADFLSKTRDNEDWEIHQNVFNRLSVKWALPTIDRFSTNLSNKCPRFNSKYWCPNTEAVNAFDQSWGGNEYNWLVPPPHDVIKVISKMSKEKAKGTLIVPFWKSAPFWVYLCPRGTDFASFIKDSFLLPSTALVRKSKMYGVFNDTELISSIREQLDTIDIQLDAFNPGLISRLSGYLLGSRSEATVRKYSLYFSKWQQFANVTGCCALPAQSLHIALYITDLLDKNSSHGVISTTVYAIKWFHELRGLTDPTSNSYITTLLETAKRVAKSTVHKKDPISADMLITMCDNFKSSLNDLSALRDVTMSALAFAGFLRFDELISLTSKDIIFHDGYISVFIRKSKTDQYRDGHEILISKGFTSACPYSLLSKYMELADLKASDEKFLFRPLYRSGSVCRLISSNRKLSYSRTRECIIGRFKSIFCNVNIGLHSLRAGGATAAANADIPDRCWKRHGRWKSESAKDGYVKDSVSHRLRVTQTLGL